MDTRGSDGAELASVLAHRLRAEARHRRLSHERLAELIGVNPVTFSRWLNGHATPDDNNLKRIADVLHVPVGVLKREMTSRVTPIGTLATAPDSESHVVRDFQALLWSFERLSPEGREAVIDFAQRLRHEERAGLVPELVEPTDTDPEPRQGDDE